MQEDRPWPVPQMSTVRGRDGGRIQSGGVKGVIIVPDAGPAEPDDRRFLARHTMPFFWSFLLSFLLSSLV